MVSQRNLLLDVFRGLAIFLVLLRHSGLAAMTTRMGWIGVDLFFVLSGFLVSGLLFREYATGGSLRAGRFLLRRAFKIYPLFYAVVILYLFYLAWKEIPVTTGAVLAELFFYQNYRSGIIGITWSLAIEEHFYLLLALSLTLAASRGYVKGKAVPIVCLLIIALCITGRVLTNAWLPFSPYTHFFPTHLRIDSLTAGVLLSWLYHYRYDAAKIFARRYYPLLLLLIVGGLLPAFLVEAEDRFMLVPGFTLLYVAFTAALLMGLIFQVRIERSLAAVGLQWLYRALAWTGRYSYAIYLLHMLAGPAISNFINQYFFQGTLQVFPVFLLKTAANIGAGVMLTWLIEKPALRWRDRYFPSPTLKPSASNV
ncbi:acyltransferase [Nostoc ellipsosporum NOK]|nr:acyltransferase [Nostoc ellipsosporum NOK]